MTSKSHMTHPIFLTKATTLAALVGHLETAKIQALLYFTVAEWRVDCDLILRRVFDKFDKTTSLAVRSSANNEDLSTASMAGRYTSILHVRDEAQLRNAIEQVIASYGAEVSSEDEVLIQPMLLDVHLSGVAFSHDPSTGSPYRVINYSLGDDTTAVTSGSIQARTFVAAHGAQNLPQTMQRVIDLIEELQDFFSDVPIDIEFAFTSQDTLFLLQVRPLVIQSLHGDIERHQAILSRLAEKVRCGQRLHPFLPGRTTVYGVMPDWNPAEMIGVRPRPFALSLYKELITDSIWAYQRDNYGYRNLRSFPLLVHFAGQPYIDVRLSFNSFIPKDIENKLADRLVDYYIDRLTTAPVLHDKLEFEVVFSCYTLDLEERLKTLLKGGFSEDDCHQISNSLLDLTNRIIHCNEGLWREDEAKLSVLAQRREELVTSKLDAVSHIYWLLEDCKRYGTLPFAGLARAGFIAVQMLRSLVSIGVLTEADYSCFMLSLNTISAQLKRDFSSLDTSSFLLRYGHLRPGTYDIRSSRYDEAPEAYLVTQNKYKYEYKKNEPFALSLEQMRRITHLLKEHSLSSDVVELFEFLQAGIELREYAKFVFTRNLSDAISLFRSWGAQLGFTAEDLSYANVACIRELYAGADDPENMIRRSIADGKARYEETSRVWLPQLITKPEEIWAFHVPECEPNFVTQGATKGLVVQLDEHEKLAGGIVFIPSADPGFDWLFSHPIAGLVTAYGGVNSHMAIRAGELGLPSVIGAGDTLFKKWSSAKALHIDCASRRVEILS